jgi:hypothetical protein
MVTEAQMALLVKDEAKVKLRGFVRGVAVREGLLFLLRRGDPSHRETRHHPEHRDLRHSSHHIVMAGPDPAIQAVIHFAHTARHSAKRWMAGSGPAMTRLGC